MTSRFHLQDISAARMRCCDRIFLAYNWLLLVVYVLVLDLQIKAFRRLASPNGVVRMIRSFGQAHGWAFPISIAVPSQSRWRFDLLRALVDSHLVNYVWIFDDIDQYVRFDPSMDRLRLALAELEKRDLEDRVKRALAATIDIQIVIT